MPLERPSHTTNTAGRFLLLDEAGIKGGQQRRRLIVVLGGCHVEGGKVTNATGNLRHCFRCVLVLIVAVVVVVAVPIFLSFAILALLLLLLSLLLDNLLRLFLPSCCHCQILGCICVGRCLCLLLMLCFIDEDRRNLNTWFGQTFAPVHVCIDFFRVECISGANENSS